MRCAWGRGKGAHLRSYPRVSPQQKEDYIIIYDTYTIIPNPL
jgi:hypothetical protein